jgi:tagatose 6-phosphate kinase
MIDQSRQTATELIEESRPLPLAVYDLLLAKLKARLPRAGALVLSGTPPPDAPQQFYADCVALAGDLPLILDARGEPLAQALQRHPFVIKPNRIELSQTLGADLDNESGVRAAMREMIACGARWVIVTSGTAPTLLSDGARFWKVATPQVSAANPIGSGDALAAGLAVGLVRGQTVPDACLLGVACAAANAMTPHAGHVRSGDIDQLLPRLSLEQV